MFLQAVQNKVLAFNLMQKAMLEDKANFVKILIKHGFHDTLNKEQLSELYRKVGSVNSALK